MTAATPGILCISLDFELFWGLRDHARLEEHKPRLLGVREAVPRMLDAFAEHGIQATWATVGLLMCRNKEELLAHLPRRLPNYTKRALSPYSVLDSLGADEQADPFHYAPSLVERIRRTPGQEIGCHTFGHYYCLEEGQTLEDFEADLDVALALARDRGLTLRSLVLPRNQINPEYLPACARRGFICYRGLGDFFAEKGRGRLVRAARLLNSHLPLSGSMAWEPREATRDGATRLQGIFNLRAGHFLRPYSPRLARLRPLHLRRLCKDMAVAAKQGRVLHLWWHPHNSGLYLQENMAGLGTLLREFTRLRDSHGLRSLHMADLAGVCAAQASPGQGGGGKDVRGAPPGIGGGLE